MRCARFQPLSTKMQSATNPIIKRCQHHDLVSLSTHVSPLSHVMLQCLCVPKLTHQSAYWNEQGAQSGSSTKSS